MYGRSRRRARRSRPAAQALFPDRWAIVSLLAGYRVLAYSLARPTNVRAERDPGRRLDLRDLPRFQGGYRSLSQSLRGMAPGLAVLGLSLLLAVGTSSSRGLDG